MLKLPDEVLLNVFLRLPVVQKQECMFVCRKWERIIRARGLLTSVFLFPVQGSGSFLAHQKKHPHLGFPVEKLTTSISDDECLTHFPNLKSIKVSGYFNDEIVDEFPVELTTAMKTTFKRDQITELVDVSEFFVTRLLLASDLCYGLVNLKLEAVGGFEVEEEINEICILLKNMPVLKQLTISNQTLSVDVVDTIHANIPSIESLSLIDCMLDGFEFDRVYTPVPSITELVLNPDSFAVAPSYCPWIEYAYKTYPNLKHFNLYKPDHVEDNGQNREQDHGYVRHMRNLVKTFRTQLTSITLSCVLDECFQVLHALDKIGCRLNTLKVVVNENKDFIDAITESEQCNHLKKLILIGVSGAVSLADLSKMNKLESLDIQFVKPFDTLDEEIQLEELERLSTKDLVTLFNYFPRSVESIRMSGSKSKKNLKFHKIKHFELDDFEHTSRTRLDNFISDRLPNLTSLRMKETTFSDRVFMMPNHRFSQLEFSPKILEYGMHCVSLITRDCPKPRYFSRHHFKHRGYSNLTDWILPMDSEKGARVNGCITVVCASVENLFVDRLRTFLVRDVDLLASFK